MPTADRRVTPHPSNVCVAERSVVVSNAACGMLHVAVTTGAD